MERYKEYLPIMVIGALLAWALYPLLLPPTDQGSQRPYIPLKDQAMRAAAIDARTKALNEMNR